jgi:hypothetical protein
MDSEYTLVLIDGRRQNSTGDITPNGFGESNNSFIHQYLRLNVLKSYAALHQHYMAQTPSVVYQYYY